MKKPSKARQQISIEALREHLKVAQTVLRNTSRVAQELQRAADKADREAARAQYTVWGFMDRLDAAKDKQAKARRRTAR